MTDPADEAWRSECLIEYERLYHDTGNPGYAWQAFLDFCPADRPIPSWIRDYLRGCAASWLTEDQPPWRWPEPMQGSSKPGHLGLLDLFDAVRDGALSPDKAARAVPRAFGLTGPNGSAFAAKRELEREAAAVAHYEREKRKGTSEAELLSIAKNVGKSLATVKRWLPKWRGLWAAQREAKAAKVASAPRGK